MSHIHDSIAAVHVHDDGSWVTGLAAPSGIEGTATGGTTSLLSLVDNSGGVASHRWQIRSNVQFAAWLDALGSANPSAPGVTTFNATGLSPAVEYQVRARAEGVSGDSVYVTGASAWWTHNVSGGPVSIPAPVAPPPPADTTAPVLSASAVAGGTLTASASVTTTEAGTLYWLVNSSATLLSVPASPGAMTGWTSRALTVGVNAWSLGALTPGADKYLHLVAQDTQATPNRTSTDQVTGPFTVVAAVTAVTPLVTAQPVSQTVVVGQVATFTVAATGTAPLTYQWSRNDVVIAGATNNSYSLTTVEGDTGAVFSVAVSNSAGSVVSNNAVLTVNPTGLGGVISNTYEIRLPNQKSPRDLSVIERARGDTYADEFSVIVAATGLPLNITNCTFLMTLDPEQAPKTNTNNLYQLTGVVVNAFGGRFKFAPTEGQANLLGSFYYDIQMTDEMGSKRTIDVGQYLYKQDITKSV